MVETVRAVNNRRQSLRFEAALGEASVCYKQLIRMKWVLSSGLPWKQLSCTSPISYSVFAITIYFSRHEQKAYFCDISESESSSSSQQKFGTVQVQSISHSSTFFHSYLYVKVHRGIFSAHILFIPSRATRLAHPISPDFITLILAHKEHMWSSSLCNFHRHSLNSLLLC